MTQCTFIKDDGKQCEAQAVTGKNYCFAHNDEPEIAERRAEAQKAGGRNGRKYVDEPVEEETKITTLSDVVSLISDTTNRVRQNKMSPQRANCIGYLMSVATKAIEKKDLEARIEHLEALLEGRK